MQAPASAPALSIKQVLFCGAMIVTLSMGIRHGFGLWLQPITQAQDWSRQTFSFALAIQNLSWGIFGVFAGMLADRFGAFRVLIGGSVFYALGLFGMAHSPTPLLFTLSAGILIGAAQAGTTYAVIYGVIGRQIPAERRSWAMGVAAAAGSFGQFLMAPIEGRLIGHLGWQTALAVVAVLVLVIVPLAFGLREPRTAALAGHREQSVLQAVGEAFRYPSFGLLMAGYFVCGFQLAFIGIHMPTYLRDRALPAEVAGYALALIGLFNVFGTYTVGLLGQKLAKRKILAAIYFARAVSIALFLLAPLSPMSVYVFSAAMGFLWLSTVPATNAIVAGIFGVAHLSMLSGFVFLSHQVGSFLGVWLGGYLYDTTGSYDIVWYISIALGVFAALINLPVKESAIVRAPARWARRADRGHRPHVAATTPIHGPCRLACRGGSGAGRGVRDVRAPGVPGDAGRPDLVVFLKPEPRGPSGMKEPAPMHGLSAPSLWVVRWSHLLAPRTTVLDVACGAGRHMQWFAAQGHEVTGVDRSAEALATAGAFGRTLEADIESGSWPFGGRAFGAVIVTNYLWRPRLADIVSAVAPGGVLLYETFAAGNETVGKPSRPDFLLQPGELLAACADLRVVAYEDGFEPAPERFVQRIAAVRPAPGSAGAPRRHLLKGN